MFINKGVMKPFVKRDERTDGCTHGRMDGHRAFYNLPSLAYRPAGDNKAIHFFKAVVHIMISIKFKAESVNNCQVNMAIFAFSYNGFIFQICLSECHQNIDSEKRKKSERIDFISSVFFLVQQLSLLK